MAGFNPTNFAAALKTRYATDFVESMAYKDKPFLAMVKKMTDMGGDSWKQPVLYENPQSRSATFSQAQALAASARSRVKAFAVTRVKDYGDITLDGELIEASKREPDAFFRTTTEKIDGIMQATAISAATSLYRKGWGAIGRLGAAPAASTTLTLANKEDIVNFAEGQELVGATAEDSGVLLNSGASALVVSVNRSAGTMVLSANTNTVWTANADHIFIKGDRENTASPTRLKIAGLEDWTPLTAPSSTAFFGVDRTSDTRLSGCRLDASATAPSGLLNEEEALIEGSILTQREGGMPDVAFINPTRFGNLIKLLGSKKQYVDVAAGTKGNIGFRGIEVFTPSGTVKVIPDRFCPVNRIFLLQLDTWMLGSLGDVPRILKHSGLEAVQMGSEDSIEIRVGYYGNLICKAPGWNCVIGF